MHVEVDQAAEPLHERDRPGARCAEAALAGDPPLPCPDRAHGEVADPGGPRRVSREPEPQRLGDREHPLAIRRARQHVVDKVRRGVRHPSRCTRRTQAAAFAAERDDDLVMARRAAYAREAMREDAAAQVLGELALDVARKATTIGVAQLGKHRLRVA